MIKQGAVRVNGERVMDTGLRLPRGTDAVIQVGKRKIARVVIA